MNDQKIISRIDHGECPYCGDPDIYEDRQEWIDDREMHQERICSSCEKSWKEKFIFQEIVLEDDRTVHIPY